MSANKKLLLLPGDGIGPEVIGVTRRVVEWFDKRGVLAFDMDEGLIGGVSYERVDDAGLHITLKELPRTLDVDHVVICAGQEPLRALQAPLQAAGVTVHLIGGAHTAGELDAKRAIRQAAELAMHI